MFCPFILKLVSRWSFRMIRNVWRDERVSTVDLYWNNINDLLKIGNNSLRSSPVILFPYPGQYNIVTHWTCFLNKLPRFYPEHFFPRNFHNLVGSGACPGFPFYAIDGLCMFRAYRKGENNSNMDFIFVPNDFFFLFKFFFYKHNILEI